MIGIIFLSSNTDQVEYALAMERVTASFDRKTVEEIRRVAGRRGVSAFLQVAARERLAKLRELVLIDELDTKYGAPSAAVRREVGADARRIFRR
jgi:hypothetical protein